VDVEFNVRERLRAASVRNNVTFNTYTNKFPLAVVDVVAEIDLGRTISYVNLKSSRISGLKIS